MKPIYIYVYRESVMKPIYIYIYREREKFMYTDLLIEQLYVLSLYI